MGMAKCTKISAVVTKFKFAIVALVFALIILVIEQNNGPIKEFEVEEIFF